jgi:hypothetical protein
MKLSQNRICGFPHDCVVFQHAGVLFRMTALNTLGEVVTIAAIGRFSETLINNSLLAVE